MRRAGILLHVSSLPSSDLGPSAYAFVDFLQQAGQSLWQVLPINACRKGYLFYEPISFFAGNYLFISPILLMQEGLLKDHEVKTIKDKKVLLDLAFSRFKPGCDFESFYEENRGWLEDYATYMSRREKTIKERFYFEQFVFYKQWKTLKEYANSKGVLIVGDLPMYPAMESVEVYTKRHLFKLDVVSGVPPDSFSPTGQLWGTPVYNWEKLAKEGFKYHVERIKHQLKLFDVVRLDHFRGYCAYWEVPRGEKTAVKGRWVEVPTKEFLETLLKVIPRERLWVEDLGYLDEKVHYYREHYQLTGMAVLEFAFDEKDSPYLPHNLKENCVYYTGTHDNPPLKGWFKALEPTGRQRLIKYLGKKVSQESVAWECIRLVYMSVCRYAIVQMQDLLNLGIKARMNTPGKPKGNWRWKLKDLPSQELAQRLKDFTIVYGRYP